MTANAAEVSKSSTVSGGKEYEQLMEMLQCREGAVGASGGPPHPKDSLDSLSCQVEAVLCVMRLTTSFLALDRSLEQSACYTLPALVLILVKTLGMKKKKKKKKKSETPYTVSVCVVGFSSVKDSRYEEEEERRRRRARPRTL